MTDQIRTPSGPDLPVRPDYDPDDPPALEPVEPSEDDPATSPEHPTEDE